MNASADEAEKHQAVTLESIQLEPAHPGSVKLQMLGWSSFFADQLDPDDAGLTPMRIATVHRARMSAMSPDGPIKLALPVHANTGDYAVGDWVLVEPATHMLKRRLARKTVLQRHTEGGRVPQLAGANIDTLFIVTSCNGDFNAARLERYLVFANESGAEPVVLLTKADLVDDSTRYQAEAGGRARGAGERAGGSCARCAARHAARHATSDGGHSRERFQRPPHHNIAFAARHSRRRLGH
jgi:hypothetical protein